MATRVGVVAAVAGAAVVALLSAALALYGQPLDTGTRSRAAFSDRRRRDGAGAAGTGVVFAARAWLRRQAAGSRGAGAGAGLAWRVTTRTQLRTTRAGRRWSGAFRTVSGLDVATIIVKEF